MPFSKTGCLWKRTWMLAFLENSVQDTHLVSHFSTQCIFNQQRAHMNETDPNTTKWLKDAHDKVFGFPNIIRFSWSTSDRFLESNAHAVNWNSEPADDAKKTTGKRRKTTKSNENSDEEDEENDVQSGVVNKENVMSKFFTIKSTNMSMLDRLGLTSVQSLWFLIGINRYSLGDFGPK